MEKKIIGFLVLTISFFVTGCSSSKDGRFGILSGLIAWSHQDWPSSASAFLETANGAESAGALPAVLSYGWRSALGTRQLFAAALGTLAVLLFGLWRFGTGAGPAPAGALGAGADVHNAIFGASPGQKLPPMGAQGGWAVVEVKKVDRLDMTKYAQQRAEIAQSLRQNLGTQLMSVLLEAEKAKLDIKINPSYLKQSV